MRRFVVAGMLLGMVLLLAFTIRATLERSILDNAHLMSDAWFQVTLLDAYLGFAIFYFWVAWKEQTLVSRILWFMLIMVFGNMATTFYVLLQLWKLDPDRPSFEILISIPKSTHTGVDTFADRAGSASIQ